MGSWTVLFIAALSSFFCTGSFCKSETEGLRKPNGRFGVGGFCGKGALSSLKAALGIPLLVSWPLWMTSHSNQFRVWAALGPCLRRRGPKGVPPLTSSLKLLLLFQRGGVWWVCLGVLRSIAPGASSRLWQNRSSWQKFPLGQIQTTQHGSCSHGSLLGMESFKPWCPCFPLMHHHKADGQEQPFPPSPWKAVYRVPALTCPRSDNYRWKSHASFLLVFLLFSR